MAETTTGGELETTLPTLGPMTSVSSTGAGPSPTTTGPTSGAGSTTDDPTDPPEDPARSVIVHLFEWRWESVARECELFLGPAGFDAVQVSPPQEYPADVAGAPWWDRYQPVSYRIGGRSGDEAAFDDMVARCRDAGVDIIVDAVINHMAWQHQGVGVLGTQYQEYQYGDLYQDGDFHPCRQSIQNWDSRDEVQTCELFGLPDLDTGSARVRGRIAGYLSDLHLRGVAGFRIDAAKHIAASELEQIFAELPPELDSFLEVIADQTIAASEYTELGRVTEFGYGYALSDAIRQGSMAGLAQLGEGSGLMPSEQAVVFIDNHDTQRGHGAGGGVLTYKEPELHRLALVFMLGWPYGRPKVMSSFAFSDDDARPELGPDGLIVASHDARGECVGPWVCEHRLEEVEAMVQLRNTCHEAALGAWWDDAGAAVAFERQGCAVVAINRNAEHSVSVSMKTELPVGRYCDAIAGCVTSSVEVGASGEVELEVPPLSARAFHLGTKEAP